MMDKNLDIKLHEEIYGAITEVITARHPRIKGAYCASIAYGIIEFISQRNSAPLPQAQAALPALTVWYGPMPESSGAQNYTATLMRKGASMFDTNSYTFQRSEYPDRVRYEADCMRFLIGELDNEPRIQDYDADKHSGYVEPDAPPLTAIGQMQDAAPVAQAVLSDEWIRSLPVFHVQANGFMRKGVYLDDILAALPESASASAAPEVRAVQHGDGELPPLPAGYCATLTGQCQCEPGQQKGCVSWRARQPAPVEDATPIGYIVSHDSAGGNFFALNDTSSSYKGMKEVYKDRCRLVFAESPTYQQGRAAGMDELANLLVNQGEILGLVADTAIRALKKTGAA